MEAVLKRHSSGEPTPAAWLIAIAITLLTIGVTVWGLHQAVAIYSSLATEELERALAEDDLPRASIALRRALRLPEYAKWLFGFSFSEERRNSGAAAAEDLFNILRDIKAGSTGQALSSLDQVPQQTLDVVFARHSQNQGPESTDSLRKQLQALALIDQNLNAAILSLGQTSDARALLRQDFTRIAVELAGFLTLAAPKSFEGPLDSLLYSDGILSGVPRLPQLRDKIDSPLVLKQEIDRLGGIVRTQSPNPVAEFTAKIAELKDRSLSLLYEDKRLADREIEATKQLQVLERQRAKFAHIVSTSIKSLILALAEPG